MEVLLITQARTGSSRLPGKVLLEVNSQSLLEIHIRRIKNTKLTSAIVLATTSNKADQKLVSLAKQLGIKSFAGSEDDVLDRFYQVALQYKPKWIVRVTADCPLIDPILIDELIDYTIKNDLDYCSNCVNASFPDGQDVEVFKFDPLAEAWKNAMLLSEREHVTPYIRKHFKCKDFPSTQNFSNIRMTVDEQQDFELMELLIANLGINRTWQEYTAYIIKNNLTKINENIQRNEGYNKSLQKDA